MELVLYIAGASKSGSTALSLLLDNHPDIVAVSQLEWLSAYAEPGGGEPCSCGQPIATCPFWNRVAKEFGRLTSTPTDFMFQDAYVQTMGSTTLPLATRIAHKALLGMSSTRGLAAASLLFPQLGWDLKAGKRNALLFQAIRAASRKSIVVDASKNADRCKTLYLNAPDSMRVVWLVRDGRAVMSSRMKQAGCSARQGAWIWLRSNLATAMQLASIPRRRWIVLRYESLCVDPTSELDRIGSLLGLSQWTAPRTLEKRRAHLVGGNEMRYRELERELRVDEKWKTDLDGASLQTFERIAGWMNRTFGYE